MLYEKRIHETEELIRMLDKRIKLFEAYLKENHLEEAFVQFCEQHRAKDRRPERFPVRDQIPKR